MTPEISRNTFVARAGAFLRVDLEYVVSGNFWLGLFQLIAIISVICLTILFGRIVPRETYGEYSFLVAIGETISAFSLTGFATVIIQTVARGYEGTFSLAVQRTRQWSFLMVLLACSIGAYYFIGGNTTYALIFLLMAITIPLYRVSSLSDSLLIGRKSFKISSAYNIFATLSVTLLLAAAVVARADLLALATVYLVGRALIEYAIYRSTLARYPLRNDAVEDGSESYALHLSLLKLVAMVADQADSLVLFFLAGPANLALYSFVIGAPELIKGFIKNISSLAQPRFSGRALREIRRTLLSKMLLVSVVVAALVGAYVFAAPYLFALFLPKYLDAVHGSQIFSLSLILVAAAALPISALQASMAKERLYKYTLVTELLQVVFLCIGIKYYGVMGAVGAYIVARTCRLVYASWLVWTA